jgi:hypothetical protein
MHPQLFITGSEVGNSKFFLSAGIPMIGSEVGNVK